MADGDLLHGQVLAGKLQTPIAYTQQSTDKPGADAQVGDANKEVTPQNHQNSMVKVYSAPANGSHYLYSRTYGPIDLPLVLASLSITFVDGGDDTTYIEAATSSASGNYSVGASVSGTAQASAFCIPKALWAYAPPPPLTVPFDDYYFYSASVDTTTILGILSGILGQTVHPWPIFKATPIILTLTGLKVSANCRASFQGSVSSSSGGASATESNGIGFGSDYAPQVEQVQIPATLHASFSLTSSGSVSHTGVTLVTVSGILTGGGGDTAHAVATGSVTPTSIAATTPSALPTSGLYAYRVEPELAPDYGAYYIHVRVFDFSTIA